MNDGGRRGPFVASADYPTVAAVEDCSDVHRCLSWNRFLPSPTTVSEAKVIEAVIKRLGELRRLDNYAYVRASKALGWRP